MDSGASLDGRVDDASTPLDAAAIDGAAPSDASAPIDAARADGAVAVDASTRDGGGTGTSPTEVCEVLCSAIEACFKGGGGAPDPGCVEDCSADLADCSEAQRTSLLACQDDGCALGSDPEPAVVECITMVGCVDMGGGEPSPPPMPRP